LLPLLVSFLTPVFVKVSSLENNHIISNPIPIYRLYLKINFGKGKQGFLKI